jgi:4-carboxymuconolactone decarboxylase
MARIALITEATGLEGDQLTEFQAVAQGNGQVRGPYGALLHSPGLAQKMSEAGAILRTSGDLTPVERELAIIAVARERDSNYDWAQHVRIGRTVGLNEEAIEVVRNTGDVSVLDADEADIVSFVRQLLRNNRVESELFQRLCERHSERWVVDLVATIAHFQYLAAFNTTFEILPSPDDDQLPV